MGISGALGAASLAGGIYGAIEGSPAQNVPLPPQWNMPNMTGAANQAYSGIGGLPGYNLYGPNIGQAQNITQGLVNNPYAPGYQAGANMAGSMGQLAGLNAFGAGGNLYNAGNQALMASMDPQTALYQRTLQQIQDQTRVANAAAGVGTTPYGAGLEGQNITNFNIDWQYQQLQRELAGVQGAGTAFNQGANLQSGGVGTYLQGAGVPYSTYGAIGQGQLSALGNLGAFGSAGQGVAQTPIQDYLNYIAAGNQAGGVANTQAQTALQQAQQSYNQNLGFGSMIGGGLGALSGTKGWQNFFNPSGGGGYSPQSSNPAQIGSLY